MGRLVNLFAGMELRATGKWFLLSGLIGIVAGLGAVFFQFAIQAVLHFTLGNLAGYVPKETAGEASYFSKPADVEPRPWMIVLVMLGGGVASGVLVYKFAPEAEGHGTDAAIDAYHNRSGVIRPRVPIVKTLASAVTLGTGGSGGREGPIAQIGAGFGSFLAGRLKLPARDRRIMLAAGMGAGVGAIFRAPLAGALFAGEILYSTADLESEVIVPTAIASIVGYGVFEMCSPAELRFVPVFGSHLQHSIGSLFELIPLGVLALILTLAAILFIKAFYGTHRLFSRLPIPNYLRPMAGAGLTGLFALIVFYAMDDQRSLAILSTGHGALQEAIENAAQMGVPLLLVIALGKLITTSLSIGSGGSGGVFGPSVFIGGCLGAAVGQAFHQWWPEAVPNPQVYGIVGMAGFFAGAAHAPISTIIMVTEMTGDYLLLFPAMWVSTLCFLLCRRWKLYQKQVPSRLESPVHRGDFIVDVLEGIYVRDVPPNNRPLTRVPEAMPLKQILRLLAETRQHYFPVVDENGRMIGIFSADDVRSYLFDDVLWQLAVARDIMTSAIVKVTPDDDLNTALTRFTERNLDELPIVDPENSQVLLGMLRRKDTIGLYNQRVLELKKETDGV